jgi:hypothetical protein
MLLYRVVAVASCYVANCYVANCYVESCVVANCVVASCYVANLYGHRNFVSRYEIIRNFANSFQYFTDTLRNGISFTTVYI